MKRQLAHRFLLLLAVIWLLLSLSLCTLALGQESDRSPVWVTRVSGVIDPPVASFLSKTMQRAAKAGAQALIIELDTPGGLDSSMRQIIQAELGTPVAVVIYVWPEGARAASAGVYIMMGADVAAMAPKTNLGAAQPVSLGGEMDEEMKKKVVNDAAAYIRSLAEGSGRNADWAERAVRESVSLTASEALDEKVIEFVAADRDDLLRQMDGFTTKAKGITLRTAGAPVREVGMNFWERFLHVLANPEIAFILLTIGIYGIIFELQTPGIGVGGVVGALCILLALYSLQILPVNYLGLALMILALGLFVAEIFVQSYGLLALGGTVALVFGGLLLFDVPEFLRISWWVLGTVAACTLSFFAFALVKVLKARRARPQTGREQLIGLPAVVVRPLTPGGTVRVSGELWRAVLEPTAPGEQVGSASPGETVTVVGLDGLTLRVRKEESKEGTA